jgi:hypothetical protein
LCEGASEPFPAGWLIDADEAADAAAIGMMAFHNSVQRLPPRVHD